MGFTVISKSFTAQPCEKLFTALLHVAFSHELLIIYVSSKGSCKPMYQHTKAHESLCISTQRLMQACASAQSQQNLCCSHT